MHITNHNWLRDGICDFSVSAGHCNPQFLGCSVDVGENLSYRIFCCAWGKQQARLKPAWACSHCCDVVGIDMDGVPADFFRSKRDRIGFRDQVLGTEVNHSTVLTETRTNQHPGVWRSVESDAGFEQSDW